MNSVKMNTIQVIMAKNADLKYNIDLVKGRKHSARIRESVKDLPTGQPKEVVVEGPAPGAVKFVLDRVSRSRGQLHISVHYESLPIAVKVLHAIEYFQIEPAQPQVLNQVLYKLRSYKLTPTDIEAVHTTFGDQKNQCWEVMVHQLGAYFARQLLTAEEEQSIIEVCEKYPDLNHAVIDKQYELEQREIEKQRWIARKEARKEAELWRQKKAEHDQCIAEKNEKQYWNESHGYCATSEGTVKWLKAKAMPYKIVDKSSGARLGA